MTLLASVALAQAPVGFARSNANSDNGAHHENEPPDLDNISEDLGDNVSDGDNENRSGDGQAIHVKESTLRDHECDSTEWHFVINQIDEQDDAPASIHVAWANGAEADVPLSKFSGKVAHYTTTDNLDSTVADATATIADEEWNGQFNLSHGPCQGPVTTHTLSGRKFLDADPLGDEAAGNVEPGLSGWHVQVLQADCQTFVKEAVTDQLGFYSLELNAGTYCVQEVIKEHWAQTYPDGNDSATNRTDNGDGSWTVNLTESDVREVDFGNVGPPCNGRVQETAKGGSVTFSGAWKHRVDRKASGGGLQNSNVPGAGASFTFIGQGTRLIATTGPMMGKLDVYVDGQYHTTADLYSPTIKYQQVVAAIFGLSDGEHTVSYRISSDKNPQSSGYYCPLDRFDHHTQE